MVRRVLYIKVRENELADQIATLLQYIASCRFCYISHISGLFFIGEVCKVTQLSKLLLSSLLAIVYTDHGLAATFTPLGDYPAGLFGSGANGISGDGTTIVGGGSVLDLPSGEAAQWSASGVITALRDDVTDDGFNRSAGAASQDGSVIVGSRRERVFEILPIQEAYRWTTEEGIVNLGFLPGSSSSPSDVSGDGQIIVGTSIDPIGFSRDFRWTNETGMVSLGTLPANFPESSHGLGISADGSIIVGTTSSGNGQEAFRWTEETGMVGLGDLPGGFVSSGAEDISSDGTTIVGSSSSELSQGSSEAYRWTEETGMQGLGFLNPTDHTSTAGFTSSNGRLVFGFAFGFDSHQF